MKTRKRTYIDASVLIAAFQGDEIISSRAMKVLEDPYRELVVSDFLRLEVLPKTTCHGNDAEAQFYETFFQAARRTVRTSRNLISQAHEEAAGAGLAAMDALHVAAAKAGKSDELITVEKATKPSFRVSGIAVKTIRPET